MSRFTVRAQDNVLKITLTIDEDTDAMTSYDIPEKEALGNAIDQQLPICAQRYLGLLVEIVSGAARPGWISEGAAREVVTR